MMPATVMTFRMDLFPNTMMPEIAIPGTTASGCFRDFI